MMEVEIDKRLIVEMCRSRGCVCPSPEIVALDEPPPGTHAGVAIIHDLGCPLWRSRGPADLAGVEPDGIITVNLDG